MADKFSVWKYQITKRVTSLHMPAGARVLSVGNQGETMTLWAAVNPDAEQEERTFVAIATGEVVADSPGPFVGTVILQWGQLVFHIFEEV